MYTIRRSEALSLNGTGVWSVSPVRMPWRYYCTKFTFVSRYGSQCENLAWYMVAHAAVRCMSQRWRSHTRLLWKSCWEFSWRYRSTSSNLDLVFLIQYLLMRVLFLRKTEPVARSVFTYLQTWTFSPYENSSCRNCNECITHWSAKRIWTSCMELATCLGYAVWARSIAYASKKGPESFKIILLYESKVLLLEPPCSLQFLYVNFIFLDVSCFLFLCVSV